MQPNRAIYLETLRAMSPEQRLAKAFELTEMTREALRAGIKMRYPQASEAEVQARYLERLERTWRRKMRSSRESSEWA